MANGIINGVVAPCEYSKAQVKNSTKANKIGYADNTSPAMALIWSIWASTKVVPNVTIPRITARELIPERNVGANTMESGDVLQKTTIKHAALSIQMMMISRVPIGLPISKPGRNCGNAARITIAIVAIMNRTTENFSLVVLSPFSLRTYALSLLQTV